MAVSAYKVVQSLGDKLTEGEIVHLDEDKAAALVDAGILEAATEEDMAGGEDVETEDAPGVVENAAKALETKLTEATEKAVKILGEKMGKNVTAPVIPNKVAAQAVDKSWGFDSIGSFAACVIARGNQDSGAARKMEAAQKAADQWAAKSKGWDARFGRQKDAYSTSGGPTITATDGGVLIPPQYASELFTKHVDGTANLYDFCNDIPYANTTVVPINAKTGYNSGVRSYWVSEYSQATQTNPVLDHVDLKADTLVALVPVTEQLLTENAYSLDSYIKQEVPEQMVYRKNASLLYGNGSGANVMSAASTVVVTRATSNRITFADLNNMYARAANPGRSNWYVSPSYFPELQRLSFPDSSGSYPIFVPTPNGYPNISAPVPGTLHGRPVVLCDMFQALGTKGDIMFGDLGSVAKIEKQLDASVSVHFYFDRLASLFRFAIRTNTISQWKSTWTRPDTTTVGPLVLLSGSSIVPPTFS